MSIERAIADFQAEIDSFNQGTNLQPKDGTVEWFKLRALNIGMTYLKRTQQLGAHSDLAAAERFHVACDKTFKLTGVPPAHVIVHETSTVPGP